GLRRDPLRLPVDRVRPVAPDDPERWPVGRPGRDPRRSGDRPRDRRRAVRRVRPAARPHPVLTMAIAQHGTVPLPMPLALRPYTPLRMVLTVCGVCFSEDPDREIEYETDILQGNLVAMDCHVYLRRICRRGHGEVVSLYEEDADLWESLQQWRVPTREIVPDRSGNTAP